MRLRIAFVLVLVAASPALAQPADPGSSRLVWGPTGRLVAAGETTVTTYQLFAVPTVQVGVTSKFQMGFGTPIYRSVLLSPKLQLYSSRAADPSSRRTDVAGGVVHVWIPGVGAGGYGYVAATHGKPDAAVTVSGGVVYGDGRHAIVSVGGERRLSPRVVWITENYFTREGVMTSGGFRIAGPNKSVDLVLGWLITEQGIAPLPVLNIGWRY